MTPTTLPMLTDSIPDKGWAALAGAVACALYCMGDAPDVPLDRTLLTNVVSRLPYVLRQDALHLGFDHDDVCHGVVDFLQSRFAELESLSAFLQSPPLLP